MVWPAVSAESTQVSPLLAEVYAAPGAGLPEVQVLLPALQALQPVRSVAAGLAVSLPDDSALQRAGPVRDSVVPEQE